MSGSICPPPLHPSLSDANRDGGEEKFFAEEAKRVARFIFLGVLICSRGLTGNFFGVGGGCVQDGRGRKEGG